MPIAQTSSSHSRLRRPKSWKQWVNMKLQDIPDVETKYFDATISATPINTTGVVFDLCGIPQGLTQSTRVGLNIKCTSHYWNMTVQGNPTVTTNSYMRVIFFIWKGAVGGTSGGPSPVVADILSNGSTFFLSPYNRQNSRDIFTVLSDKTYVLATGQSYLQIIKKYKKIWAGMTFEDNTGIPPISNGLYMLAVSSENTNPPLLQFDHRLNYEDA